MNKVIEVIVAVVFAAFMGYFAGLITGVSTYCEPPKQEWRQYGA